ncbi:F0F1 ATP synthase subunit gamma [Microbulbifer yueqingensis]|uniref:F-type H+-transporting ATPase subunit gamma n=1 Tax=Microbulbifer yueqingensis TaxID=658219 RepID=A0A1G8ZU91_9GAMM|nr:FoF1 ATP synthase subunit gamma [Microbulbifer yueqingensis]SDK18567.1 F-type H+-transporting ATPase subunit gamma [Microbulbifer yueqingensis]
MSNRRTLLRHAGNLREMREIISSMKSLAFMETRRIEHFVDRQRRVVDIIEIAAADFLAFYPDTLARDTWADGAERNRVLLVLGSERGFCGGFNESLVTELAQQVRQADGGAAVVACGRRLCDRLVGHPQLVASLDGAAVADEIEHTLNELVSTLSEIQQRGPLLLRMLHHEPGREEVTVRDLLPPFTGPLPRIQRRAFAPQLNMLPREFLLELVDLYLFSVLHEILYLSLMAENQERLRHLEGAVRYLDERLEALKHRSNQLRQEEITEEIEVILLSASDLAGITVNRRDGGGQAG